MRIDKVVVSPPKGGAAQKHDGEVSRGPVDTQYKTFFVSPFGEASVCDELNVFLKAHRIVNVEFSAGAAKNE